MIIQVTFEFLQALHNDQITLVPTYFEENDIQYVKDVDFFCESKSTVGGANLMPEGKGNNEFTKVKVPPYLAAKDFARWVQSVYPQGRVKILDQSLN